MANVNLLTSGQQRTPEAVIGLRMPHRAETGLLQIAEPILRVFVEATRHHEAVPSNQECQSLQQWGLSACFTAYFPLGMGRYLAQRSKLGISGLPC